MKEAVELVEKGTSLRVAADTKGVNYVTLSRYVKKKKNDDDTGVENTRMTPNYAVRKVFTSEQEKSLEEYLVTCSKMCYGLDTIETRRLAYQMAVHHNLNIPSNWQQNQIAGIDWLYGFRKRHPDLRLRKPEACSLSRATSFNKFNVNIFFDNLVEVMKRDCSFGDGTRLYSLDETGTTTVQKPKKVLASKTSRQLNKVTSAERGTLVTTCCIVSAIGNALPPAMIFPRKNFKPYMTNGAPPGTLGLAQPTGWMTGDMFLEVLKHFIKMTSSTRENPTLIIMDNHESHLTPAVLNHAKENGVTLLTIPPHTSHKLQALDVSVFGPFQNYYNSAADSWMYRNPGQTLTIYHVAELVGQAFEKAMTPTNIKSGFRKTGIFPLDRDIFTDEDFFTSEVTNRQEPSKQNESQEERTIQTLECQKIIPSTDQESVPMPSTSQETLASTSQEIRLSFNIESEIRETGVTAHQEAEISATFLNQLKSPIECRDYPRAGLRKNTYKRKKGKSSILTDTPVKNEIEERARARNEKNNKNILRQKTVPKKAKIDKEKVEMIKKVIFTSSESSDEDNLPLITKKTPVINDFVLVRFPGKQSKYFVGEIIDEAAEGGDYEISYLRKSAKKDNSFLFPLEPDLALVSPTDIEIVLPQPTTTGKTKRQVNIYTFPTNILKKYALG